MQMQHPNVPLEWDSLKQKIWSIWSPDNQKIALCCGYQQLKKNSRLWREKRLCKRNMPIDFDRCINRGFNVKCITGKKRDSVPDIGYWNSSQLFAWTLLPFPGRLFEDAMILCPCLNRIIIQNSTYRKSVFNDFTVSAFLRWTITIL